MQEIEIPRYVDSQAQIFFWEIDEFVVSVGLFGVGIVTDSLLLAFVLIYLASSTLRRIKSVSLEGAFLHVMYWTGVLGLNRMPFDGSRRKKWV